MTDNAPVSYDQAFDDLSAVYLEDSWVLAVAAAASQIRFILDAVLTPDHPSYSVPSVNEQHCYCRGTLTIRSVDPIDFVPSGQPGTHDPSGEIDFGNIDTFRRVELAGVSVWQLAGDWGTASVRRPLVVLTLDA
ncbi:hypothetical protein SAMN05892883_2759 [Jatrophihabitans sp. GAS493]|uniref:hypothetical protein n=1 Tax=Jatrophihabitans sp. GAS493 TaxID=1907575 RepID=UPI000BB8512A|nr:hypothetical protein [Jatrophihabitans sp. GAS493]SOD73463.1 hypothetical protein SAMN05892883_2759 [Jatrophihabitans sp. GAS493]